MPFLSQLLAGAAYALASRSSGALWLVNLFLFLNWLGDSLDGTLARVRNRQRPRYGLYVDHIADTFGALALLAGLGCSGYLHWQIAAALLICFYALSIESYLATYSIGRFSCFPRHLPPHRASNPARHRQCRPRRASLPAHREQVFSALRRCRCGRHCGHGAHGALCRPPPHSPALSRGSALVNAAFRFGRFALVGLLGAVLQLLLLQLLSKHLRMSVTAATPLVVEIVLLHDFLWHERFTWRDRRFKTPRQSALRLWRFHIANGLTSLLGNTLLIYVLVDRLKAPLLASAMGAIVLCSLLNFFLANRWSTTSARIGDPAQTQIP